jgi:UDP-N-acetylglucosamine 2-epimerase
MKAEIHLIAAARPNFMKIAPLFHQLKMVDWADPVLVHTGQHYDPQMSESLIFHHRIFISGSARAVMLNKRPGL